MRTSTLRTRQRIALRLALSSLVMIAAVSMATTSTRGAETTPEQHAANIVEPSVVYIETTWLVYVHDGGEWTAWDWTTRCTGFIVNADGHIVTAGHCVDPQEARNAAITGRVDELLAAGTVTAADYPSFLQRAMMNWTTEGTDAGSEPDRDVVVMHGTAASGLQGGRSWPARVVDFSPLDEGDVALLKIEASNLPAVELAADEPEIGTAVLSIGYPASSDSVVDATFEPTFKDGKISSRKTRGNGLIPVYEISAALAGGMSGGPTVDLDGRVIGLNSFGISGEVQAFNFLTPSSLISEMLAQNAAVNELSATDHAYREALDAFHAGDYGTAIERLDAVLDLMPSHPQAQEIRAEAFALAADGTSSNTGSNPRPIDDDLTDAEVAEQEAESSAAASASVDTDGEATGQTGSITAPQVHPPVSAGGQESADSPIALLVAAPLAGLLLVGAYLLGRRH